MKQSLLLGPELLNLLLQLLLLVSFQLSLHLVTLGRELSCGLLTLGWSRVRLHIIVNVDVVLVVNDGVLHLADDVHGRQHIQSIVYSSLHVLELHFVTELLVQLKNLICYFSACGHGILSDALQNGS